MQIESRRRLGLIFGIKATLIPTTNLFDFGPLRTQKFQLVMDTTASVSTKRCSRLCPTRARRYLRYKRKSRGNKKRRPGRRFYGQLNRQLCRSFASPCNTQAGQPDAKKRQGSGLRYPARGRQRRSGLALTTETEPEALAGYLSRHGATRA